MMSFAIWRTVSRMLFSGWHLTEHSRVISVVEIKSAKKGLLSKLSCFLVYFFWNYRGRPRFEEASSRAPQMSLVAHSLLIRSFLDPFILHGRCMTRGLNAKHEFCSLT